MTKTEPVTRAATDGIAVAGMANPPVHALGAAVRAASWMPCGAPPPTGGWMAW